MKTRIMAMSGFILLGLLLAVPRQATAQDTNKSSTLQVRPNYTGSGTVDEKHKIYVVLWDSPAFVSGEAMPIEIEATSSKQGVVTFADVKKVPAYISVAFDPSGQWDGKSGPPPEGTSLGLYSKTPGKPEPVDIAPGKTVKIEVSFDDTVKMRPGGPSRQAQ